MSHLDIELQTLKKETLAMWKLVKLQLEKSQHALITFDKNLAREVVANEKRVNAYELKIDRDCENIFALFNPVAVDLRFVLAVLKINSNLERIGDITEGVCRFIVDVDHNFDQDLIKSSRILQMFETAVNMLTDVADAFENEDSKLARTTFEKDEILDAINEKASHGIVDYIIKNQEQGRHALHVLSMIRKLERVGDQIKNISEEIIFYIEAKVLKHKSDRERK